MEVFKYLNLRNAMVAAFVLTAWLGSTVLYRLFFHPLAKVPGPKWAAVTRLYLFYFNAIKDGTLYRKIEELHEIYGPIVRIAPNEIHLNDPEDYDKIYSIGSKYDKDPQFYSAIGSDNMFAVSSNVAHKARRGPLNPFFSRRAILELEDMVHGKAESLCEVMENRIKHEESVNLHDGYRALAIDVATGYSFDDCWDHIHAPDFGIWFSEMVKNSGRTFWVMQQFPIILTIMLALPPWLARKTSPAVADMLDTKLRAKKAVQEVQDSIHQGLKSRRRTIFHELLDPQTNTTSKLPTVDDISGEAFAICVAAADTSGNAMTTATYNVIRNPRMMATLQAELREAFPDPNERFSYASLERLPYLTGVVREAQRLSYGIVSRMPRIVPPGGETFSGYYVPGGTIVGMSNYLMHRNNEAFPDPDIFDPMRWINQPPEVLRARERCFVPFARGSRNCLGQNLALCELYIVLGTLFRRYEAFETRDIGRLVYIDYFNIFHPAGAKPLVNLTAARVSS